MRPFSVGPLFGPEARGQAGPEPGLLKRLLGSLLLQLGLLGVAWAQPQATLPVTQLSAGLYVIHAEVASTPAQLQRGLMFRESLGPQHGMLFHFGQRTRHCMWMLNTLIPLSVAFLRYDGTITNIEDMAPHTRNGHCATEPVQFALEMEQGWFEQRGIEAGDRIRGLPPTTP